MTSAYNKTDWRDVLYTSVRNTAGGVVDAALFLTNRRDRKMHKETLRGKLRGAENESVSIELADLLTEWMAEKGQSDATAWIKALGTSHGLVFIELDRLGPALDSEKEVLGLYKKGMRLHENGGKISGLLVDAIEDFVISSKESDLIAAQIDEQLRALAILRRNVLATTKPNRKADRG